MTIRLVTFKMMTAQEEREAIEEFEKAIEYRMTRATPNVSRREAINRMKKLAGSYSWKDFKWDMGLPEGYKIKHD